MEDPRFPPASLDMVFMVNAFHDLEKPVELLANLLPALKPGATVVVMDRDPARSGERHFLTREQVEEIVGRSAFEIGPDRDVPPLPQPLHPQGQGLTPARDGRAAAYSVSRLRVSVSTFAKAAATYASSFFRALALSFL